MRLPPWASAVQIQAICCLTRRLQRDALRYSGVRGIVVVRRWIFRQMPEGQCVLELEHKWKWSSTSVSSAARCGQGVHTPPAGPPSQAVPSLPRSRFRFRCRFRSSHHSHSLPRLPPPLPQPRRDASTRQPERPRALEVEDSAAHASAVQEERASFLRASRRATAQASAILYRVAACPPLNGEARSLHT